jgi:hypothetical protein
MREHGSLPRARQGGLLEETVGEELLLYDQESHTAHCLSPIAACVWRHCDGDRNIAELARLTGVSESLVASALHELREKDLLDAEPELTQSTVPGVSRREAIVRVARYGAAATAGSMIVSATAATPAMASSELIKNCNAKPGTKKSCCKCTNGVCTSHGGEIKEKDCIEECENMGRLVQKETFEREGACE